MLASQLCHSNPWRNSARKIALQIKALPDPAAQHSDANFLGEKIADQARVWRADAAQFPAASWALGAVGAPLPADKAGRTIANADGTP